MDVYKSIIQWEIKNKITLRVKRHQTTQRGGRRDHSVEKNKYMLSGLRLPSGDIGHARVSFIDDYITNR